jgi:hypothetical protein
MVKQYPHTLTWTTEGTPSTKDPETGFPVPGVPAAPVTAASRYENFRGGSVKEFINKKNETVRQRGTIYLKKGEPVPRKFETVVMYGKEGEIIFEGELLNVYTGQLNVTIAV